MTTYSEGPDGQIKQASCENNLAIHAVMLNWSRMLFFRDL